jgi:hypothetical protein
MESFKGLKKQLQKPAYKDVKLAYVQWAPTVDLDDYVDFADFSEPGFEKV